MKRATRASSPRAIAARLAAPATTSSAWALICSVVADTSWAAALFSCDTAAMEPMLRVTESEAAAMRPAPAVVRCDDPGDVVARAGDLVRRPLRSSSRAPNTRARASSRAAVAAPISTTLSAPRRPIASPVSTSAAPAPMAATASLVPRWTSAIS